MNPLCITCEREYLLPQVLLNHSIQDRQSVEQLFHSLSARGWNVQGSWQLPATHRLEEYLETVLPTVGCIVTFWTESSLSNHQVKDIAHEANRLGIAVPVILEGIKLPLALRELPPVDMRHHNPAIPDSPVVNELVDTVESVLVGSGYPEAAPKEKEPTLSIRVARRVLEELRKTDAVDNPEATTRERFQLGDWQADVGANTLTRGNSTKKLAPRTMEVLAYLTARSPDTVAVQDVLRDVWRDRIVVDSVVHKCVRELRVALEDDYRQPTYIETHAKRGYRIIARVA